MSDGQPCKTPKQIKNTKKAKRRFWRKEVRAAKSQAKDYARIRSRYPEIGWLSGLWCNTSLHTTKEKRRQPYRHIQILDRDTIRIATRGYLKAEIKKVWPIRPPGGRPTRYFDLWYDDGPSSYRLVAVERIEKVSDSRFHRVYSKGGRNQERDFNLDRHMREQALKITPNRFFKKPNVYVKAVRGKCG